MFDVRHPVPLSARIHQGHMLSAGLGLVQLGLLAQVTGLQQSFVGTLFVAISTSLPEVVVSTAAVRIGAIDMAAANLFGSNLFNVAVLGILLATQG